MRLCESKCSFFTLSVFFLICHVYLAVPKTLQEGAVPQSPGTASISSLSATTQHTLTTVKGHKNVFFLFGLFCRKPCFALIPVLKRQLMWVISYLPLCFASGADLSIHCKNTAHSFARSPTGCCSFLHVWLVGYEKAASQAFALDHQDFFFPSLE